MKDVLEIAIPIIGVIVSGVLSYWLGSRTTYNQLKRESYNNRIDKFYAPFFRLLYDQGQTKMLYYSDLEPELQKQLRDLILDNILIAASQDYAVKFLEALKAWESGIEPEKSKVDMDEFFTAFVNGAIEEYKRIGKKVGLPESTLPSFQHYLC